MALILLRHAWAGHREAWVDEDDDSLRPLDERGHRQSLALVGLLAEYPLARILSSPYLRCVQTVEPLAAVRGLPVEPLEELGEHRQARDGLPLLRSLAGTDALLCTHGGTPWTELAGGRYKKGEALVLDDELRPMERSRAKV